MSAWDGIDRRNGPRDRRACAEDRRNSERVAEDKFPRRNPEVEDRRAARDARRAPERTIDEAYLRRAERRSQHRAAGS